MHLLVVGAAAIWMTVLFAATVLIAIRTSSMAERLVAIDTMTLVLVALLALYAASNQKAYYLDAALALALFSFIGTVVAARRMVAARIL